MEEAGGHTGLTGDVLQRGRPVALTAQDGRRGVHDLASPSGFVVLGAIAERCSRGRRADHHDGVNPNAAGRSFTKPAAQAMGL